MTVEFPAVIDLDMENIRSPIKGGVEEVTMERFQRRPPVLAAILLHDLRLPMSFSVFGDFFKYHVGLIEFLE